MSIDTTILNLVAAFVLVAPPDFDPTDSTVRRLRSNEIQLLGRDPCEWTGLHCARLPVHTSDDVDTVVLPLTGYGITDLRTFSRLHNLRHVRSNRPLTEQQYHALNASVPATVWFSFSVRMNDGTIVPLRSRRSLHWDAFADTNGDGVIDDQEEADLRFKEPVPPRVNIGK